MLQAVENSSMQSGQFGYHQVDPLAAASGAFADIARDYGPIDFKNQFSGGNKPGWRRVPVTL